MKLIKNIIAITLLILLLITNASAQNGLENVKIKTSIFEIEYSQRFQQPLVVKYKVQCPTGDEERDGMTFKKWTGVVTSDDDDYIDNVWDKGHMAPAGAFTCNITNLRNTFTYLNCALQHESLNRGPWKELEHFEKDLSKVFSNVTIEIRVHFIDNPQNWLSTGALVPIGFTKIIRVNGNKFEFYFPNINSTGHDWVEYQIN